MNHTYCGLHVWCDLIHLCDLEFFRSISIFNTIAALKNGHFVIYTFLCVAIRVATMIVLVWLCVFL